LQNLLKKTEILVFSQQDFLQSSLCHARENVKKGGHEARPFLLFYR